MDLLAIYLEDHLALSLAGIRLARRTLGENRDGPLGAFLRGLVPELEEDRELLVRVARAVGSDRSVVKDALAVAGEWAGRLKPNGRLLAYSALSRVWELEALLAGTESRREAFHALGRLRRSDARLSPFEFERHEQRARAHREALQRYHVKAAQAAFAQGRDARIGRAATSER
jgi:hypothetical protein